jgi:hypothetical protein
MEKSESIKELAAALAKAQGEIGKAIRDSANPFFKSKYADLGSVVDAIKEPLTNNGLSYTQVLHDAENAVCVETVILHASGEWISCGRLTVPVSKHDAQGFGSALTYARRYGLSAAFSVATAEDDGNAAVASWPGQKAETAKPVKVVKAEPVVVKAEPVESSENSLLFVDQMVDWGSVAKTPDDLSGVWKNNQETIDGIKKSDPELFKRLQATFADFKKSLTKE